MLLQLSHFFSPFSPLPSTPIPSSISPFSSCTWVVLISSLASPFPILFLTYPPPIYFVPTIYVSYSLYLFLPFAHSSLLITLHVISISVILFLFQLFAQFIFVFLDSIVDSCGCVVILLFIVLLFFFFLDKSLNISHNKGLVMMNPLNETLSGKYFICPSILNDCFAGQSNL